MWQRETLYKWKFSSWETRLDTEGTPNYGKGKMGSPKELSWFTICLTRVYGRHNYR